MLLFNNAEITYLKSLYDEEIAHFKMVLVDRFLDILSEVGERISKFRVIKFSRDTLATTKLTDWKNFLDIFAHIKRRKMSGGFIAAAANAANVGMIVKQSMAASLLAEVRTNTATGHRIFKYSRERVLQEQSHKASDVGHAR